MYEVTRTYKVYPFNELPEKLKDKARDQFRDDLVNQALNDAQDSIYWEYMPGEFGMEMNLKEGLYFDLYYNTVSFVAYPVDYLTLYEEFLLPRMRAWRVPPTPWAEKYIRHIIKAGWGCFTWKIEHGRLGLRDYAYVVAEYDDSHPVAEFRQSRLEAQADEALRQVCRAFEELGADMIGAALKMLKTIRHDAEQDSYVDEFLNFNEYEFEVDENGCYVGVH